MCGLRMSGTRLALAAGALLITLPSTGCVGLASQLMYWAHGNPVEAKYKGLKGERVAVICASPNQAPTSDGVPQRIAQKVGDLLAKNVKGIEVVPQSEIDNWIDRHDWDRIDCKAVGRGVKADKLVEIKLAEFSVNEGSVFFKGRAKPTISVYDMKQKGKLDYQEGPISFTYPRDGVRTSTETSEAQFQAVVIQVLDETIAKHFYKYEKVEDFAGDARFLVD